LEVYGSVGGRGFEPTIISTPGGPAPDGEKPVPNCNESRTTAATPVQYEADSRKDDIRLFAVVFASVAIIGSGIFAIVILSRRHFS
jgi:hypothetical protein